GQVELVGARPARPLLRPVRHPRVRRATRRQEPGAGAGPLGLVSKGGGVNAMAMPARDDGPEDSTFAGGFLTPVDRWTADLAMKLLPQSNGPKVEIFRGSVVVSPHAGVDHQIVAAELVARLRPAARAAGFRAYPEVNVRVGDELYIPDLSVFKTSGAGKAILDVADAVRLVEIVSEEYRR